MIGSEKASAYAVSFVDTKLQMLANTLDGTARALQASSALSGTDSFAEQMMSPLKAKIEQTAAGIRSKQGVELVGAAKEKIVMHPTFAVGLGAAVGALLAQVAIVAIKSERRDMKKAWKLETR